MWQSVPMAEQVLQAVQCLYYHPEKSVQKQANEWLQTWQQSQEAWTVSGLILRDQNAGLDAHAFSAQTLRTKVLHAARWTVIYMWMNKCMDLISKNCCIPGSLSDCVFAIRRRHGEFIWITYSLVQHNMWLIWLKLQAVDHSLDCDRPKMLTNILCLVCKVD